MGGDVDFVGTVISHNTASYVRALAASAFKAPLK